MCWLWVYCQFPPQKSLLSLSSVERVLSLSPRRMYIPTTEKVCVCVCLIQFLAEEFEPYTWSKQGFLRSTCSMWGEGCLHVRRLRQAYDFFTLSTQMTDPYYFPPYRCERNKYRRSTKLWFWAAESAILFYFSALATMYCCLLMDYG